MYKLLSPNIVNYKNNKNFIYLIMKDLLVNIHVKQGEVEKNEA
jgi:hypothetical protein